LKAWDEAIGIDWNFDEFMIHHAPVPMQDIKFFSKFDDAVFVMKYLELWHSSVNLMEKFSSINIGEIRIQYINSMIFSAHNINIKAKETVSNHNAMVSSFKLYIFHYALVCCIHILNYLFFLSPLCI
jgi:hypothetical protein